jgi:hypothetical protein
VLRGQVSASCFLTTKIISVGEYCANGKKTIPKRFRRGGKLKENQSDRCDQSDGSPMSDGYSPFDFEKMPDDIFANTPFCLINQASYLLKKLAAAFKVDYRAFL